MTAFVHCSKSIDPPSDEPARSKACWTIIPAVSLSTNIPFLLSSVWNRPAALERNIESPRRLVIASLEELKVPVAIAGARTCSRDANIVLSILRPIASLSDIIASAAFTTSTALPVFGSICVAAGGVGPMNLDEKSLRTLLYISILDGASSRSAVTGRSGNTFESCFA